MQPVGSHGFIVEHLCIQLASACSWMLMVLIVHYVLLLFDIHVVYYPKISRLIGIMSMQLVSFLMAYIVYIMYLFYLYLSQPNSIILLWHI